MNLLLSILTSLVIVFSPQTSEAPTSSPSFEIGMEIGEDGCPLEEPCIDYEAEEKVEGFAAFGFYPDEDAWATFEELNLSSSTSQVPMGYEYVASFEGSVPDFGPTFFTIKSTTHEGVKHVFEVTALTAA